MGLSDDEIKQLRENLKNPVQVKAMFAELRLEINSRLDQFGTRQTQNEVEYALKEVLMIELETRSYVFNLLELLFLNQLKTNDNVELIADCLSNPNNPELLQKLRQNLQ